MRAPPHFIDAAIEQGAAAIVHDAVEWNAAWSVPHLLVSDLKRLAGPVAHAFYGMPDSAMFSVGVTGTNGKTSCALWLAQALARLGETASVIGTLGVGLFKPRGAIEFDVTGYTTPDAVLLARKLAAMRDAGAKAVGHRSVVDRPGPGPRGRHAFRCRLFTNLTRDHLDYHGDMAAYEAAKVKLFDWPGLKTAVINLDDAMGLRLARHVRRQAGRRISA